MMQFWNHLYKGTLQKVCLKADVVAHTCNPGIREAEAALQVKSYPNLGREF